MTKRDNKPNFTLKITRSGKEVERYQTHFKRRFYNRIRTIKWDCSYYLKVSYGKLLSNSGKYENFWNDGLYDNKKDLMLALNAFTED
jgi:hypothetical protein